MSGRETIFFDIEADEKSVLDIGAVSEDNRVFHSAKKQDFVRFVGGAEYAVGHNIFEHDLHYLTGCFAEAHVTKFIDTLVWSPLLFSNKPYHNLVKDYKLESDELNNPVNDSRLCKQLFDKELDAFVRLDERLKCIYYGLLKDKTEYKDFFVYAEYSHMPRNFPEAIRQSFRMRLCANAPIEQLINKYPVELAYALAIISANDVTSITPPWVLMRYPKVENTLYVLRGRRCAGCEYCNSFTDEVTALKEFFGYPKFRLYGGEALQQKAVKAAVDNKSLLAVFPTGGGKSITFQLPALMAYRAVRGLTVVISPLQSLMKDQVDNLADKSITQAATVNGQLDTVQAADERKRVEDGEVAILYISPESLRSKSMETLLLKRNVVRFVIDEAHCFSVWGQDFRTDYQYVGEFISNYQRLKNVTGKIPVSCFTATAKQRVIDDIVKYFKDKLNLDLELYTARASRTNLNYHVIFTEENEKFDKLTALLDGNDKPAIVFVSRTRKAEELAEKLYGHGYAARAYHGQMDNDVKIQNQEAFMKDEVRIIVATTAFGMGVDKKDVGMVIHYNISDSLENYVQEAGRAGRDENLTADCYILFNDEDLNKHFIMLNQTKISDKEISQVWRAIRDETRLRPQAALSALDIARGAGWSDAEKDIETRVKTAVNELEQSGFIRRGQNMPRIYANSIAVKNMQEASEIMSACGLFDTKDTEAAKRIIKSLISARSISKAGNAEAESRIDYISDNLGLVRGDVIRIVGLLRQAGILKDSKDMTAFLKSGNAAGGKRLLDKHFTIENAVIEAVSESKEDVNLKAFYESLEQKIPGVTLNEIKALLNYLKIKKLIDYRYKAVGENYTRNDYIELRSKFSREELTEKAVKRHNAAGKILTYLYGKYNPGIEGEQAVEFSRLELIENHKNDLFAESVTIDEVDDALFYLLKIRAMKIEGEFLVVYNRMQLRREADTKARYNKEHYKRLENYYQSRVEQIHIVGEYARKMLESGEEAERFADDYFYIQNSFFMHKYFSGRLDELKRNMTKEKYNKLFGELSERQLKIIKDDKSKNIVVAAGPGSGKTKLLTHKLASLYIAENIKHEQMLMLTFSRAAATEFKRRLMGLIGNAANFITISTFHSYCFDLLGRVGSLERTDSIVSQTVEAIKTGSVDQNKIGKLVLVIDEAQDMSAEEFELIRLLMEKNEEMRVIAVGDDDQSIYEFRGSSSEYLRKIGEFEGAVRYELSENYRSRKNIVEFANRFIEKMPGRLKTNPIRAKSEESGILRFTKYTSENLVVPTVQSVLNNLTNSEMSGTTAILARTNDEVLQIGAYLLKYGIYVKYAGNNGKVSIGSLVEMRYFCGLLHLDDELSQISDEVWKNARRQLVREYQGSDMLQTVLSALADFEDTNNKCKYKNDFMLFLAESWVEDFVRVSGGDVFVSTIHGAKGREFDNVFLMVSGYPNRLRDEDRRALYVAITRAKRNLFIHTNGRYFDGIEAENMTIAEDKTPYPPSPEIALQLGHKSVVLDAFYNVQYAIDRLQSGNELTVDCSGCYHNGKQVVLFSTKLREELAAKAQKGYTPYKAKVNAIVCWSKRADGKTAENDPHVGKECKIVLPVLYLRKSDTEQVSETR